MDKEREALVARLRELEDLRDDEGFHVVPYYRNDLRQAIAALTAPQQEPVAIVELNTGNSIPVYFGMLEKGYLLPQGTHKLYAAPPSGVREGMLGAPMNPAAMVDNAITRAAETINAEGRAEAVGTIQVGDNRTADGDTPVPSAPAPQPADGVVVPREPVIPGNNAYAHQLAAAKESEQTHVRVPVDKLTISDCYRFGFDISSIRSTATGKESEHGK